MLDRIWCVIALLCAGSSSAAPSVHPWGLPVASGAAQPQLVRHGDALLLSWIEPVDGGHRMRYAREHDGEFDPPIEIARGERWFVNWADVPALHPLQGDALVAFVLVRNGEAPYAYDVHVTQSEDGRNWSAPVRLHDDATQTEHGFASLWRETEGGFGIAWLDGRNTGASGAGHDAHAGGAMSLRAAHLRRGGERSEQEIDARTCDCCPTAAARTSLGPVLVYRDRSEDEVRDIAITRLREGAWSSPEPVHRDGWVMPACPVNGPAVAAEGEDVYVAWYTAADDSPRLKLARSSDDARHFGSPITIAAGDVIGRTGMALEDDLVAVTWLGEDADGQIVWLSVYSRSLEPRGDAIAVARPGKGRGTGYPRIALRHGTAHLVWTESGAQGVRALRGARVDLRNREG